VTLKSVVVALGILFLPASLRAMPFSQFEKMSIYAQAEFIAMMVDATVNALRTDGEADLANRVDTLFREILPGDKISLGIGVLEHNVARQSRRSRTSRKDPQARPLDVEDALLVTLRRQPTPIELSKNALGTRPRRPREFSPADVRRISD
jgi:hypothetical protein